MDYRTTVKYGFGRLRALFGNGHFFLIDLCYRYAICNDLNGKRSPMRSNKTAQNKYFGTTRKTAPSCASNKFLRLYFVAMNLTCAQNPLWFQPREVMLLTLKMSCGLVARHFRRIATNIIQCSVMTQTKSGQNPANSGHAQNLIMCKPRYPAKCGHCRNRSFEIYTRNKITK